MFTFTFFKSKFYKQFHSLNGDPGFLFRHKEDPRPWVVGPSLEAPLSECKLKSACDSQLTPPTSGWKYKTKTGSTWIADHKFELEMRKQLPEIGNITFSCSSSDLSLNVFGTYRPYLDCYSFGRKVFKHEKETLFLFGKFVCLCS